MAHRAVARWGDRREPETGAATGALACAVALVAFYGALAGTALAGNLRGDGFPAEMSSLVAANRIYFVFAAVAGPMAGWIGASVRPYGRDALWMTAAGLAALEPVVVALVEGRQLLPSPLHFAWEVSTWTPYLVQAAVGVAVAVLILTRGWRGPRTMAEGSPSAER